jgi:AraC-like DNA-binding protein
MTPARVAADLGFADQAHLTAELRALAGLTPGAVRRVSVFSKTAAQTLR